MTNTKCISWIFNDGSRRLGQDQVLRIFWLTLVSPVSFVRLNNEWAGLTPAPAPSVAYVSRKVMLQLPLFNRSTFCLQCLFCKYLATDLKRFPTLIYNEPSGWKKFLNSLSYQKCHFVLGRIHICLWRKERHNPSFAVHTLAWLWSLPSSN